MRKELLTTALCWELQAKVSVEYARTRRQLIYYCAEPDCVADLSTAKRDNLYFYAEGRHKAGCKNDTGRVDEPVVPGVPKPRPSIVPERPIPTVLGNGPAPARRKPPSAEERRALAVRLEAEPVLEPGTLEEVVNAWMKLLSDKERRFHPLRVRDMDLDYKSAFSFLAYANSDISQLECQNRVIFGAATVSDWQGLVFVTTLKKFAHGDKKIPLRLQTNSNNLLPEYLAGLVNRQVTLFWHGKIPIVSKNKTAYSFAPVQGQPFNCIAIRDGRLEP